MSKWNNILNKTRTEKTHVKRQRWHKRAVETSTCVLESEHGLTPNVCRAPWRPGSQTLRFQTLFSLPYSPFPWSPLSFTSFFSFSSPLSLPSFSFGLDRLSRFVFLTITLVFPSARDICFHVLSLCMYQLSDISACLPLLPEKPICTQSFVIFLHILQRRNLTDGLWIGSHSSDFTPSSVSSPLFSKLFLSHPSQDHPAWHWD